MFNSIYGQYFLNLYSGQHKWTGYTNLLPMPDYATRQSDIERIITEIIDIKRWWFSLDETNLEYHGLIAQVMHGHHWQKVWINCKKSLLPITAATKN